MIITGVSRGRSSQTITRASNYVVLFFKLKRLYLGVSNEIISKSTQYLIGWELFIVVIVILAASWAIVGRNG